MAKFKRLVLEGVTSPVLYHVTSVKNAANILKNDEFVLSQAYFGGRDIEFQEGNFYYLSMSRTKYGGYAQGFTNSAKANLEIDGRKLGQEYKTVNANFFEGGETENEERLIHDDPIVPNATDYIRSVHVLIDRESISSKQQRNIGFLAEFGEETNVPVFFYDDEQAWITQRDSFAKSIDDFETEDFPMFIYGKNVGLKDKSKAFIDGELDEKLRQMDRTEVRRYIEDIADNIKAAFKEPRNNDYKRKLSDRLKQFGAESARELAMKISQQR